ncbi:MAG: glutamate synthase subunit beta [Planctomycetota bacterium]
MTVHRASKAKGFLEVGRSVAPAAAPEERLLNYREFHEQMTEDELRVQASRCADCGVPFCHAFGCPLGNLVPEWNELVARGRWRDAAELLESTNNFPEITGRVCPALCEAACVLNLNDEPAAVRQNELAVIQRAFREGWIGPRPPAMETGRSVAVVGSGPAGLAAAQQLRRAGHAVTVFEKSDRAGGLLRYGIPDFKLDKRVIDRRLAQIQAEGVVLETGIEVGRDVPADALRSRFDAVCLCSGSGVPRELPVPGRELAGIHQALTLLIQQNRRVAGLAVGRDAVFARGKRVVVIGGGDTGSDCLGTALRQGAESVVQLEILPRPPEGVNPATPWPEYPNILRTSSSHEEGGERRWSVRTKSFEGENGRVARLNCAEVEWEGPRMKENPGTGFEVEADLVLLATGFLHPVHEGLLDELGVEYDDRGNVRAGPDCSTTAPSAFAAGDVTTGAWLVSHAIAAGRRMARAVDLHLMGESALPEPPPIPGRS